MIGAGADGVFAAFADRAMIVKVGVLTSLLAGSFGGGRVTTFPSGGGMSGIAAVEPVPGPKTPTT